MPGLAAVVSLDGAPIPADWLRRMQAAAPHRGVAAPASLNGLCTWFDGRLDNREELAEAFGWASTDASRGDAAYAAEAIARWGEDAPARLLGDFALISVDGAARSVLLARDAIGLRPLHYTRHQSWLLIASEVVQLLAVPGVDRSPDESAVGELLAFRPPADARTLYRHVSRVPPAHIARVDRERAVARAYWSPDPRPTLTRASDEAHAEACRSLLETAIRARTRRRPAAVFFSGGVDSSVILAVATHVARADARAEPMPLTLVFDGRPESDEAPYRDAVAVHASVAPILVAPAPVHGRTFVDAARRRAWLPDLPADAASRPLQEQAAAFDRCAITGVGGDWLFGGSPLAYADCLRRGDLFNALRRYQLDRHTEDSGWTRAGLLTAGAWPALPELVRRTLRPIARRLMHVQPPAWLRLPVAPEEPMRRPPRDASFASAQIAGILQGGWIALGLELFEQMSTEAACDVSHPLLDRRVVEFALSLPEEQRRRGTITRFVLRRAAEDLLPELVMTRTTKADFGHTIVAAIEASGGRRLFADLAIAKRGWVDGKALLGLYDRVFGGPVPLETADATLPMLWTLTAVELWARTLP